MKSRLAQERHLIDEALTELTVKNLSLKIREGSVTAVSALRTYQAKV